MKIYWIKVLAVCAMFFSSCAYAQWEFQKFCVEAAPDAGAHCKLQPDTFTPWVYGTGYGGTHPTAAASAEATVNFLGYLSNPSVCDFSYWLGEEEVVQRDGFIHSQEPVRTTIKVYIRSGGKNQKGQCVDVKTGYIMMYPGRAAKCIAPADYAELRLNSAGASTGACFTRVTDVPVACDACPAKLLKGNPIQVASQEKVEIERDILINGAMPMEFRRTYRSYRARDKNHWFNNYFKVTDYAVLGEGWVHNYDIRLAVKRVSREDLGILDLVRIQAGDGSFHYFHRRGNSSVYTSRHPSHQLIELANEWIFDDGQNEVRYVFEKDGKLREQILRNGWRISNLYVPGTSQLDKVWNTFGQGFKFQYGGGKITRVQPINSPLDEGVEFQYADSLMIGVSQSAGARQYLYAEFTGGAPLLVGVVDEYGTRYATYTYDSQARALSTERAGGVFKYTVPSAGSAIDPLGTSRNYGFQRFGHELVYRGVSKVSEFAGDLPISGGVIQSDGLVRSYRDYLYTDTTISWDVQRRLPVFITRAAGTDLAQNTAILWSSQWRLPAEVTEPGRTTTYTYDSVGNRLSQTIADTTAGGASRTTSWTYHPSGLIATETAPNGAVTSYQYDSAGNLTSATNALGHVDTYTHDGAGRVLTHTAPTGLVTTYTYDARGRVLTTKSGGLLTTLTYRPSGQVLTATLPHGHVVTYTYDAAQRLTGWSDNRGNSGAYTLDAMGNRTQEDIRNAQGQTVWRLARTINSLNRVASVTLGGQFTTTYGYDANGDWVASTNGLNQGTRHTLDALRRTKAITNAENATASLTYNALDSVTQAKDFKGVATSYTRDALGNATTETSPDSGTETAQYDALGLPKTVTDALGQATTIERDLLGRPTLITYADGRTTTLRYDLTATSKGYLGEIVDASGTTTYERDQLGRVTKKTQTLINGDTRSVSYAYASNGLLASTTYPGGQALQYVYDTTGQLTGLTWAGQTLVSGITWNPLGQPTGWSWNLPGATAALPASRSYNTAGQLTATEFSSYQYDAVGRIHGITQNLWQPASTNPQDSTLSETTASWTVQYSPTGRITGFTRTTSANGTDTATFQYDPNGNRSASTREVAGTTTSRTYSGEASHNRLLGFSQTTSAGGNSASSSVTYQYNSAGDLLSDGLTRYHYDSEGRLDSATTGQGPDAPTTKYAHNALGQRVFKTEPLFSSAATQGTGKNLNNLLADDGEEGEQEPPGLIQQFLNFWSKLWSPSTSDAEKLGWSYVYAEDGSLLGEYGSGGSASSGTAQYIYLPTASGPMPIAAIIKGQTYAVHSDHLNTPRKLTQADGQAAWQWAYSAFGEEQPTTGAKRFTSEVTTPSTGATSIPEVTFNLRYPGQYFDSETKLHYNHFRSYDGRTGRYTQGDPIGLNGGWNRFGYAEQNPLFLTDPNGLCPMCLGVLAMAEVTMLLHSAAMDPVPMPGSSIAARSSVGAAMVGQAIPATVAKITPVVQAINHGIDTGVYCAAKGVAQETAKIGELIATHGKTMSNKQLDKLVKDIRVNGIKEPLTVTSHQGQMYILDGHHRALAAPRAGLAEVPVNRVDLPFGGYRNPADLIFTPGGY